MISAASSCQLACSGLPFRHNGSVADMSRASENTSGLLELPGATNDGKRKKSLLAAA
jgi:hypothetical protein